MSTHYVPITWNMTSQSPTLFTSWANGPEGYVLALMDKTTTERLTKAEIPIISFGRPLTYELIDECFSIFFNVRGVEPHKNHRFHVLVFDDKWGIGIALSYNKLISYQFENRAAAGLGFKLPKLYHAEKTQPILSRYNRQWVI